MSMYLMPTGGFLP